MHLLLNEVNLSPKSRKKLSNTDEKKRKKVSTKALKVADHLHSGRRVTPMQHFHFCLSLHFVFISLMKYISNNFKDIFMPHFFALSIFYWHFSSIFNCSINSRHYQQKSFHFCYAKMMTLMLLSSFKFFEKFTKTNGKRVIHIKMISSI